MFRLHILKRNFFRKHLGDIDTLFLMLQAHYSVTLEKRNSLIIFDEVQMFPQARAAVKYLVKDGRYDYMETFSLISIRENVKDIVIPSKERHISMYPMDYEEFATALGEEELIKYIKRCFEEKVPLERSLHDKAMLILKEYILIGGIPMAVAAFIENGKSLEKADIEKRDILTLYREDIISRLSDYGLSPCV